MSKKTLISAFAISAVMGAIALPSNVSAHEVMVKEERVKVIKTTRRHGDADHSYLERHRKGNSRWNYRRDHKKRGYGHKHGQRKHRYERRRYRTVKQHRGFGHNHKNNHRRHHYEERRDHRPVKQYRDYRRDDGIRVHIDYDFRL